MPMTHRRAMVGVQQEWLGDYSLETFSGQIFLETASSIHNIVASSSSMVKIISIGVCTNIARAIERYPVIMNNAEFVGMHGSIYKGYGGSPQIDAEANVKYDTEAFKQVICSAITKTITPLDTCGNIVLEGTRYDCIKKSTDPLIQAIS